MIKKAESKDVCSIGKTYEELLSFEAEHGSSSGWKLGVYPTEKSAAVRTAAGEMYVLGEDGEIRASMTLNQDQAPEYREVHWQYPANDDEVLVIHTLCIPPSAAGKGYGTRMVGFTADSAAFRGCKVIRIDTWLHNEPAKRLYLRNGFRIAGTGRIRLQGLIDEKQVYLERLIQ